MASDQKPHDQFFADRMAIPDIARAFLDSYLPIRVSSMLDLDTLAPGKERFPGLSLGPRATDLVWEAGVVGGRGERVVLLFEHKSGSDPGVGRQLFGYMLRIWDHVARSGPEKSPLPVVLPILFHHGRYRWRRGTEMRVLRNVPAAFADQVPRFDCLLFDLSHLSDEEIVGPPRLRLVLLALRHIFDPDLAGKLPQIFAALGEEALSPEGRKALGEGGRTGPKWRRLGAKAMNRTGLDDLDAVMAYVKLARRDIGKAERQAALETAYPGLGESMLRTTRVEGIEEGKKIGREEGREEGRHEGAVENARDSVLEVLRARFGKVPRRVLSRVRATDDRATLMEWLRLAGTADSLAAFQAELE